MKHGAENRSIDVRSEEQCTACIVSFGTGTIEMQDGRCVPRKEKRSMRMIRVRSMSREERRDENGVLLRLSKMDLLVDSCCPTNVSCCLCFLTRPPDYNRNRRNRRVFGPSRNELCNTKTTIDRSSNIQWSTPQ